MKTERLLLIVIFSLLLGTAALTAMQYFAPDVEINTDLAVRRALPQKSTDIAADVASEDTAETTMDMSESPSPLEATDAELILPVDQDISWLEQDPLADLEVLEVPNLVLETSE